MDPITIYRGALGLNTVSDPVRIPFDADTALSALAVAVNIEIDLSQRISRRKDVTELQSGEFHSVFCDKSECVVISETTMYKVSEDLQTLTTLVTGLVPNTRMSYASHGKRLYFNNEWNRGYIEDATFYQLEPGSYLGPDTNRVYSMPKGGRHIAIFSGRLLTSVKNMLYWSEPWQFNVCDIGNSHITLDSNIRMLKPVEEGVFVSSETQTYFLQGLDPKKWRIRLRAPYPAIEWCCAAEYLDGMEIGMENPGLCALWASPEGAILGTASGYAINLTKSSVIYPEEASIGAGCLIGYNFLHRMV